MDQFRSRAVLLSQLFRRPYLPLPLAFVSIKLDFRTILFTFIFQFVMFRDYTNTKSKSVCLMKINICTQLMQERRVERQSIGGVLSEFYLNVKLSVQLLTITWKTSKESIIMVLILNGWKIFQMLVPIFQMFINLTKIFLNKETSTLENFYFFPFCSSILSKRIPWQNSNMPSRWKWLRLFLKTTNWRRERLAM